MRALLVTACIVLAAAGCSSECFIDGFHCSHELLPYGSLALGAQHSCGVRIGSTVECWGGDAVGQASPPQQPFDHLVAGDAFTCGQQYYYGGDVACWGDAPAAVADSLGDLGQLTAGRAHVCALLGIHGPVTCSGDNSFGQLEVPATLDTSGSGFPTFGQGRDFTCLQADYDRPFQCWGRNDAGQLAVPPTVASNVVGGDRFGCGLDANQQAVCWGEMTTPPIGSFRQLAAGATHVCGIRESSEIVCWGDGTNGKLAAPDGVVLFIAAGAEHSCAIQQDGQAACWGDDADGQSSPP